jgi:hypothetical protein
MKPYTENHWLTYIILFELFLFMGALNGMFLGNPVVVILGIIVALMWLGMTIYSLIRWNSFKTVTAEWMKRIGVKWFFALFILPVGLIAIIAWIGKLAA